MLDEFSEVIEKRYSDPAEFIEMHKIDLIELLETGSAVFVLDKGYLVRLEVTEL